MKVYTLKTCDTCRKAIKELKDAGRTPAITDVRADGIKAEDLALIVDTVGFETALNRRSTTWRALDEAERADMDAAKAIELIRTHPTLLKRPAIMDGDKISVGWDKAAKAAWL